jgi:hypothetical protein
MSFRERVVRLCRLALLLARRGEGACCGAEHASQVEAADFDRRPGRLLVSEMNLVISDGVLRFSLAAFM